MKYYRYITLLVSLFCTLAITAVPAKRSKTQVRQPDGTMITVMMRGDENFHFMCTEDGMPIVMDADKAYCYAYMADDGVLRASAQMAHDAKRRTQAENTFIIGHKKEVERIASFASKRAAKRNEARFQRLAGRKAAMAASGNPLTRMAGATGGEGIGVTGKRKGLVILADFQDVKMQSTHDNAEWNDFFNKVGYNTLGNTGSVHDYFYSQSYGQFDLSFDVVGPVTVSKNMADYGANDEKGNDKDPGGMIYEACKLAADKVNFADYDWDGDGEVDQVFVIYAGHSEATKPELIPNTIWPHEWNLHAAGYSLTLNGVRINTYGCTAELNDYGRTDMAGIGTACHEFSHCLGLPDIYDTSGGDCFGMDMWDVMDYGSYAGNGYRPVGYNTYQRWVSGWMQPEVLSKPTDVYDLPALSDSPKSYVIYNDYKPREYFILENRQKTGFDTELPSHGLLVIHVDYYSLIWEDNAVNTDPSRPRFSVVAADNDRSKNTLEGDTYPGTSGNTSLTDSSQPATILFNGNSVGNTSLGKPVTNISESSDGLISFLFMGGAPSMLTELSSVQTSATSFRASWNEVESADCYNLQLEELGRVSPEENLLLAEDFTGWGNGNNADGTKDWGKRLDELMANKGWTGSCVYKGAGRMKLGKLTSNGCYLKSPLIRNNKSKKITVSLVSKVYKEDSPKVMLSVVDSKGENIDREDVTHNGKRQVFVFDNPASKPFGLKVTPAVRCYIYSIGIYDGVFSESDFAATRATGDVVSVDGVKGTVYEFTSLQADVSYQWRVQAVKRGVAQKWSGWRNVKLSSSNVGVESVYDERNGITPSTIVSVYSLSGVLLGRMSYASFLRNGNFAGVYILKSGAKTFKMTKG